MSVTKKMLLHANREQAEEIKRLRAMNSLDNEIHPLDALSSEIVQRLRAMNPPHGNATANEAADEIERLQAIVDDYEEGHRITLENCGAGDEVHCSCVPSLRREIERLRAILEKRDVHLKDAFTKREQPEKVNAVQPQADPEADALWKILHPDLPMPTDKSKL